MRDDGVTEGVGCLTCLAVGLRNGSAAACCESGAGVNDRAGLALGGTRVVDPERCRRRKGYVLRPAGVWSVGVGRKELLCRAWPASIALVRLRLLMASALSSASYWRRW